MSKLDALTCRNGHGMLVRDQAIQAFVCGRCGYRVSYEDLYRMGISP